MADWFRESLVNRDKKGRFAERGGVGPGVLMTDTDRLSAILRNTSPEELKRRILRKPAPEKNQKMNDTLREKTGRSASTEEKARTAIESHLAVLRERFPDVDIKTVRPMTEDDPISESSHMGHRGDTLIYNPDKVGTKAGLKEVATQQKQGFLTKTPGHDPIEALVTHEFGHAIAESITANAGNPDKFEEYAPVQAAYAAAMRQSMDRDKLPSAYAKMNRKEAFAESVVDYLLNPPEQHSEFTKGVGKVIESLPKRKVKK